MTFLVTSPRSNNLPAFPSGSNRGVSGRDFIGSIAGAAATRYGPTVVNAVLNRADTAVNDLASRLSGGNNNNNNANMSSNPNANSTNNNNNNNGGNGGPPNRGGRRRRSGPGYPSRATGPGTVGGIPTFGFDSGIISGTIENQLQETTDDYSPLYIISGEFFPNPSLNSDSEFVSNLGSKIYFDYLVLIQGEVNSYISKEFTKENFIDYIVTISEALQLYYMIDSILAFTSHSPNTNLGMVRLRMGFSPEFYGYHVQLKETLESIAIPPNLLSYLRYMYQNFSFSNVKGSSIIRLSYMNSLCTSENGGYLNVDGPMYGSLLDKLLDMSKVAATLRKVRPNWVGQMPPSSYDALYSPEFCTFWHNCNIAFEDFDKTKGIKYSINVDSIVQKLGYGIIGDRLDGLIYASSSMYLDSKVMQLGFWLPYSDFGSDKSTNSSLLFLDRDGLIRSVSSPSHRFGSMVRYAPYVLVGQRGEFTWQVVSCNFLGIRVPQYHSVENVKQAISRGVLFLLQL